MKSNIPIAGLRAAYTTHPGHTDCRICPFFDEEADQHCHAKFVRIFRSQCNLIKLKKK